MTTIQNNISKKFLIAKKGDLFHTTMEDESKLPRLLVFQELKDGQVHFKVGVKEILNKGESADLWVDANDHSHLFPRCTDAMMEQFHQRYHQLQREMLRYASILAQRMEYKMENECVDDATICDSLLAMEQDDTPRTWGKGPKAKWRNGA